MARILQANEESIAEAAGIIRAGGLVAFPTETVYGLGANALDPGAVAKVFAAKGRPAANPLIVHVGAPEELDSLAQTGAHSDTARALMAQFWPGPLTIVLPKKPPVPDLVTGGGPTVAVRMPAHSVALALIRAAGVPLAAPSANRSEHVSPTLASHVAKSLGDAVDLILDAGATQVGLESTVIDLSEWPPRILRPGMVLPSQIEAVLGVRPAIGAGHSQDLRSPGQRRRHYAPSTPLRIVTADELSQVAERPIGLIAFNRTNIPRGINSEHVILMPQEAVSYAAKLYEALHELDEANLALILVEDLPGTEAWLAVRDRLTRAAARR